MNIRLKASQRRTYDAVFRHPVAHNLHWRDVRSLLGAVADVVEEKNGNLKVTQSGHTLILHPAQHQHVATATEMMEIRYFLERAGEAAAPPNLRHGGAALASAERGTGGSVAPPGGKHLLVVIDHTRADGCGHGIC